MNPMGPLTGIHVLDLASFIAGPYAAMLLGDMGASVIKVEPPGGDLARAWAPFIKGESRFFLAWNRNKRGMVLDLKQPEARQTLYALVRRADVVIENFRPGVTEKLGIDYPTLSIINPRLIYASSTAFGSRGPEAARPGYDPVLQAVGGAARLNARFNGGQDAICGIAVADFQAAMLIVSAVTAALFHRERSGQGQKIETSLLQAIMTVQPHYFAQPLECEEEGGLGIYPYRLFDTAGGSLFIAAGTDKFWRLLCDAIGAPELGADARYAANSQRVQNAAKLSALLQPLLFRKTASEWEQILVQAGVPCGRVCSHQEFFDSPQVAAMNMNPVIAHPTIGPIRTFGSPMEFEKTPAGIQRPAPRLGEHTEEILAELSLGNLEVPAGSGP
jgi:crotonobetainyl-CoA:carnitine CoA-transferase CaiB-like acyl-CoA transferase